MLESHKMILSSDCGFEYELGPESTVGEYILRRCEEYAKAGRKTFVKNVSTEETYNFSDVEPMSRKIASALYKRGMRKGDTIVYSTHPNAKLHIFFVGVWRANGIVRSSYPEDVGEILMERIVESNAKWILCDESYAAENIAAAAKINWPVEVLVFGKADGCISVDDFLNDDGKDFPNLEVGRKDLALILPTSGTTGSSKGAIYTHESLLRNILIYEHVAFTDKPEEPLLITSKPTHYTGTVCPLAYIAAGRLCFLMSTVTTESILQTIDTHKVYGLMSFPTFLLGLVNHPSAKNYNISSLCYVSTAGQSVTPSMMSVINQIPNLKCFVTIYGMTEAGLLTSNSDFTAEQNGVYRADNEMRPFSVGKVTPGSSLQVIDATTGNILGPGEKGELCFKTPILCDGYLDRPKDTAETFQEGWIKSGDVGYYDEDGFVFLVDRAKEIFKYFNNHISPTELENIILQHPDVREVCVVGVPDPDGGDSIPRAFVSLKEFSVATAEEIREFLDSRVVSYKRLRGGLYILPSIPRGKTGKITRKIVAELPVLPN